MVAVVLLLLDWEAFHLRGCVCIYNPRDIYGYSLRVSGWKITPAPDYFLGQFWESKYLAKTKAGLSTFPTYIQPFRRVPRPFNLCRDSDRQA